MSAKKTVALSFFFFLGEGEGTKGFADLAERLWARQMPFSSPSLWPIGVGPG